MSGICGWVSLDGAPLPDEALRRFCDGLAFRSPAGVVTRTIGAAALALGRGGGTTADVGAPLEREGAWIVADARIDAQPALRAALASCGRRPASGASAAELILEAYLAWGEACVGHLLGDFAFAIWNPRNRSLLCARDPFGVKPFYYAHSDRGFAFSNTLACLRAHPMISGTLSHEAIADFLVFERSSEPGRTIFRDVARLPSGHALAVGPQGVATRRYWDIPRSIPLRYRDPREQVEAFDAVLRDAVADRLGDGATAILMSGGLDSTAIARHAAEISEGGAGSRLRAYTVTYETLFADDERGFAEMAAADAGIPLTILRGDGYGPFDRFGEAPGLFPEPTNKPFAAIELDTAREAAKHARVMLTGWDGDTLLSESPRAYFRHLGRTGRWARLLAEAPRYAWREKKLVPAGFLSRFLGVAPETAARLPAWLEPGFARRHRLAERVAQAHSEARVPHPTRPYAMRALEYLQGDALFFEGYDPGCTGVPLEYRHPFMDLRVVEHALSLPPFPWCVRKEILRAAMRGRLPERVRLRPKTPLAGYPHLAFPHPARDMAAALGAAHPVWEFIDRDRMHSSCATDDPDLAWTNFRPLALGLWLQHAGVLKGPHQGAVA